MNIVFFTGAGISVAAGLPTYRGEDGKYTPGSSNFVPPIVVDSKLSLADFVEGCNQVRALRPQLEAIEPTYCHKRIAELEAQYNVTIITQNIDNLHKRAGSTNVIELHGNVFEEYFDDDFRVERPNVVFFGEQLNLNVYDAALGAVEDCDIFVSIGTSGEVQPAAGIWQWAVEQNWAKNKPATYHLDPNAPVFHLAKTKHFKMPADEGIDKVIEEVLK